MSSLMILHIGPIWSILFGKLKWFLCTLMGQLMATWQRVNQNMSPWTSQVLTLTAHISEDRDMSPVCKHDHYLFTICSCIASIACIHTNGNNWQLLESQNQPLHLPRLHFTLKRGVQLSASHTDTLYIIFKHILTWSICVYLILQRNWGAAQSMAAKRPKRTGEYYVDMMLMQLRKHELAFRLQQTGRVSWCACNLQLKRTYCKRTQRVHRIIWCIGHWSVIHPVPKSIEILFWTLSKSTFHTPFFSQSQIQKGPSKTEQLKVASTDDSARCAKPRGGQGQYRIS